MFVGTYPRSVDKKGRLLVPADMVRTLDATDREGYYLAPGDGCIQLFKRSTFHRLAAGLATPTPFANTRFNRAFFGQAAYRPTDSMGRILLPEPLREAAGVAGDAVLVGCGEYLEIWSTERHGAAAGDEATPADLLQAWATKTDGPATSR